MERQSESGDETKRWGRWIQQLEKTSASEQIRAPVKEPERCAQLNFRTGLFYSQLCREELC